MTITTVLRVDRLTKRYRSGGQWLKVLDAVSFDVPAGATCAVTGPSGSGKTTLLGLCAGLDRPDEGGVSIAGTDIGRLSEEDRARLRRESIGFVFQSFRLVSTLTALENVLIPLELRGERNAGNRAIQILERVGLAGRLHHFPSQLSGGEQQRVGIARAFIHRPRILFADEPTGNLDDATGAAVTDLLFELNRTEGTALVIVTHDAGLARRTGRVLRLTGGRLAGSGPSEHGG